MSDSIRVPSKTVAWFKAIAKLFIPVAMIAAGTAWTTAASWIKTRTSVDEIRPLIGECNALAKGAQDQLKTQHAQIYTLQETGQTLAEMVVELHAQAEVVRAYSGSKRLPEYVERARKFYRAEFERQQVEHPHELVRALQLTRLAVWRPDRSP